MDYTIIIPAYNEAKRICPTLLDIAHYCTQEKLEVEILVIDDGSTDTTVSLIEQFHTYDSRIRLIRLAQNFGKGHAVRTGFLNARAPYVLFTDADGATPIGELERLRTVLDDGFDIAIGSRGIQTSKTLVEANWFRHILGRMFHFSVLCLGISGIVDTQCGFKLGKKAVIEDIAGRMRMVGFSFDVEMLWIAKLQGYRVAEVPINWTHQEGSKVNILYDGIRMLRDLVRIRKNTVQGRYKYSKVASTLPMDDSIVKELVATYKQSS